MKYAYLAFEDYENELESEIKFKKIKLTTQMGRLFFSDEWATFHWAQLSLKNFKKVNFKSINDAIKILKAENLYWGAYSYQLHRRTELIQNGLQNRKISEIPFLAKPTNRNYGFWFLLDSNTLLYSAKTDSSHPLGFVRIKEALQGPPSRAYQKLYEALTVHTEPPAAGTQVLDLGSCPGGWTWVLHELGCQVISVDKAPLDDSLNDKKRITYLKKDAFKLDPLSIENPEWLFSDIICEPEALLELVLKWQKAYPKLKFLCTIKYKGPTDFKTTDIFAKIPGSKLIHLCCNKHEMTWIKN